MAAANDAVGVVEFWAAVAQHRHDKKATSLFCECVADTYN